MPFNSQAILSNSYRIILITTLIRQYQTITSVRKCLIALRNKLIKLSYVSHYKKVKPRLNKIGSITFTQ